MDKTQQIRERVRQIIKKKLDEMTTTANVPGYLTPYSFRGNKAKSVARSKHIATATTGFKLTPKGEEEANRPADKMEIVTKELNENKYYEYKNDTSKTPHRKIAEEFIQKLKGLFEESYIQVPEEKVDVVEELAAKLEDMEEKLNSLVAENIELRSVAESKNQQDIFVEVSEGLALSQVEKFRTLAEGVDYDSAETYRKKLEIVKEQYFTEKKAASKTIEEQEMVELDEEVTPQAKAPAGPVSNYVSAIARTIKK